MNKTCPICSGNLTGTMVVKGALAEKMICPHCNEKLRVETNLPRLMAYMVVCSLILTLAMLMVMNLPEYVRVLILSVASGLMLWFSVVEALHIEKQSESNSKGSGSQ
jgi:hypothetical protein